MIYTAPCVMFLMRADALRGEVGPSEIARADRRVQFHNRFYEPEPPFMYVTDCCLFLPHLMYTARINYITHGAV